jgi:hypothetical protein
MRGNKMNKELTAQEAASLIEEKCTLPYTIVAKPIDYGNRILICAFTSEGRDVLGREAVREQWSRRDRLDRFIAVLNNAEF